MSRVLDALRVTWIACLTIAGGMFGALVGYANGGPVGAFFLGLVGAGIGAGLGAAGSAGLELLLL